MTNTLVDHRPATSLLAAAGAYLRLTKPRVIELLLVTTLPAMILAADGQPRASLAVAVLVGGAFAAGGANTINCWIERDRDLRMSRTARRPLPAGVIEPGRALWFGLALELAAFVILWRGANLLAAGLAVGAMLFYVFVYTIWLKPRSAQNIVIGGAAGAAPVLVGWAAVTGTLGPPAWVLFAIIFLWTPPHFWALALRYRDDYAAAGFPMLPVTRGASAATRQILGYAVSVVLASLVLPFVADIGVFYVAVALVSGVGFVVAAVRLHRAPTPEGGIAYFRLSNLYLACLFVAVAIDTLVA